MPRTLLLATAVVLTSVSVSLAAPSSGMLLGIYAFPNFRGLRVLDTMPDYSAHGRLFRHDVVSRVTADGVNVYPTRNFQQFEFAKDQIGPNRPAALEVFRPGQGYIYLWVEFIPVGPALRSYRAGAAAAPAVKARVMTEQEKPGAARLFKRSRKNSASPKQPQPRRRVDSNRAANLFGR